MTQLEQQPEGTRKVADILLTPRGPVLVHKYIPCHCIREKLKCPISRGS